MTAAEEQPKLQYRLFLAEGPKVTAGLEHTSSAPPTKLQPHPSTLLGSLPGIRAAELGLDSDQVVAKRDGET